MSYLVIKPYLADGPFLAFLALCFAFGVLACHRTGRDLGVADHGSIVWDEIVPFWLILVFTPPGLLWQGLAFLLFRGFDILKPYPANVIDARMKHGLGVMLDDVAAAAYTLVVLALVVRVLG
jgi:phosphatidylglycerophosphatase A